MTRLVLSYRILFDAFSSSQATERIVISNNGHGQELGWKVWFSSLMHLGLGTLTIGIDLQIFAGGSGNAATNPGQDLE